MKCRRVPASPLPLPRANPRARHINTGDEDDDEGSEWEDEEEDEEEDWDEEDEDEDDDGSEAGGGVDDDVLGEVRRGLRQARARLTAALPEERAGVEALVAQLEGLEREIRAGMR